MNKPKSIFTISSIILNFLLGVSITLLIVFVVCGPIYYYSKDDMKTADINGKFLYDDVCESVSNILEENKNMDFKDIDKRKVVEEEIRSALNSEYYNKSIIVLTEDTIKVRIILETKQGKIAETTLSSK
jgi:hypothetical protein